QFLSDIVDSPYMDDLNQYTAHPRGTIAQTNGIAGPLPWQDYVPSVLGSSVTDGDIQSAIQTEIANHAVVSRGGNRLYFVFLEPGVGVSDQPGAAGYHGVDQNGDYYAVVLYGATPAGTKNLTDFQKMTTTASHELVEAITDPISNISVLTNPVGTIEG